MDEDPLFGYTWWEMTQKTGPECLSRPLRRGCITIIRRRMISVMMMMMMI
jgi:hypothetical protein